MEEKDEALYIKVIIYDTAGDRSAVYIWLCICGQYSHGMGALRGAGIGVGIDQHDILQMPPLWQGHTGQQYSESEVLPIVRRGSWHEAIQNQLLWQMPQEQEWHIESVLNRRTDGTYSERVHTSAYSDCRVRCRQPEQGYGTYCGYSDSYSQRGSCNILQDSGIVGGKA